MPNALSSSIAFLEDRWGVEVVVGNAPRALAKPTRDEGFMQMAPGEFLALIDDLGRMHVTTDRVVLDPDPGVDLADMDYLVYGWAPRWIRVLRSQFTLHASAVLHRGRAIAVMGFSGAGKSTTVTALDRRGYPLVIDDVLPVDIDGEVPSVHGWERPVHLTDEAAAHLRVDETARVGTGELSKIAATVPSVEGSWPLAIAIELRPDESASAVQVTRLTAATKLQAVVNHSNGAGFSAADGRAHDFFAWATRVTRAIDVVRVVRPTEGWHLEGVVDAIVSTIESEGNP
ncbi:MAG: hypothetical protein GC156_03785 [Actinomycetales bacterium]|nr:hypothetical protein [Actinomycetales bacterium]